MHLRLKCYCGRVFHVPEEMEGRRAACPSCRETNLAPTQVRFECVRCGRRLKVGREHAGRKGKCSYCGNVSLVPEPENEQDLKNCPFCAERILRDASKCRFCGEYIDAGRTREPHEGVLSRVFGFLGKKVSDGSLQRIPIDRIECNPYQPREHLRGDRLARLRQSVKTYGVIVPLIVRATEGGRYQLVAGQRRLAACQDLGIRTIPAIVRDLTIKEMIELSFLENLHRDELSPVEKAQAFARLREECPQTSDRLLAEQLGRDPGEVHRENSLLDLPVLLREAISMGMLTEEVGRILGDLPEGDILLQGIEKAYYGHMSADEVRAVVAQLLRRETHYVATRRGGYFHRRTCPLAAVIPTCNVVPIYTAAQAVSSGRRPCLLCAPETTSAETTAPRTAAASHQARRANAGPRPAA